jgi:hypothetical protein
MAAAVDSNVVRARGPGVRVSAGSYATSEPPPLNWRGGYDIPRQAELLVFQHQYAACPQSLSGQHHVHNSEFYVLRRDAKDSLMQLLINGILETRTGQHINRGR